MFFAQFGNSEHHISFNYPDDDYSDTLPLHAISAGNFACDENYFTKRDNLDNFLLIYTKKGMGYVEHKNKSYDLPPSSVVVVDCSEYHHYKTTVGDWCFLWVHFNGMCAKNFYTLLNEGGFHPTILHENNELDIIFNKLFSLSFKISNQKQLVASHLLHTIFTAVALEQSTASVSPKYATHKEAINKVTKYIEQYYNTDISVDTLSDIANISKYYLIKIFKHFMGKTPYEYILEYRISIAKLYLAQNNLSISEITTLIGFNDSKIFITNFKKITGFTPLQYKSKNSILLP